MLRYKASIRELFYRSCTADRSFVPQDDKRIGYVMGSLSKHSWQRPLRTSLRQAQTDRPSHIENKHMIIRHVLPRTMQIVHAYYEIATLSLAMTNF